MLCTTLDPVYEVTGRNNTVVLAVCATNKRARRLQRKAGRGLVVCAPPFLCFHPSPPLLSRVELTSGELLYMQHTGYEHRLHRLDYVQYHTIPQFHSHSVRRLSSRKNKRTRGITQLAKVAYQPLNR